MEIYQKRSLDNTHFVIFQKTKYFAGNYEQEIIDESIRELHYIAGPMGLAAIYVKNNGTDSMYYTHTDHLGSITEITNNTGTLLQRMQYDAWGKRSFITNNIGINNFLFDRGYTGHEHLDQFALINMNGRLYDPILGCMLSPDNYVQNATGTQGFNRYSYAMNNPMVYVDPDGEFVFSILSFIFDFAKTIFSGGIDPWNTPENRQEAWQNFDPSASWSITNKAWRIEKGLFQTDPNKTTGGRAWELISRFTWQSPQTSIGYAATGIHNLLGGVKKVEYYGGSTVAESYSEDWGAITLGNYINGQRGISADPNNRLFQHEYGHYLQSQEAGLLYLTAYGIPSIMAPAETQSFAPVEQDANRRALSYFMKNESGYTINSVNGKGWNAYSNPIHWYDLYQDYGYQNSNYTDYYNLYNP